ncbi:hypothetical protein LPJ61_004948 [Coemansia biformis]|uniref:Uncharacterized protein n=1 Tax=Coemansia biformis TaxID=1286918 RepID=A0A9W7Y3X8_9FUNG|nr:hypothetical protein LPJ61_004948 [Coemansia biformis]
MLDFIHRLPKLTNLTFYKVTLGDIQRDMSIPTSKECEPIALLGSTIRKLAISFSRQQFVPEQAVAVAKYLLLRIPSLTAFYATPIPEGPIQAFVNTHALHYPHLAAIDLKLNGKHGVCLHAV